MRNAEVSDAGPLIDYLRITAAETPYLIREPEEIVAKKSGYVQAEFEVISENRDAIALYRNLGFEKYGLFPNNMKYSDGTYANAEWMLKKL